MDKETQKDTRQRMQKKENTPCNNQLKRTKRKGRQKEGNLPPRKLSPEKCLQKNQEATESPLLKKQLNSPCLSQQIPLPCLSLSIQSRLVRCAGPMLPSAKKVLLWIGSPGAMMVADTKRSVLASCALPWWWSQATSTEWMGNNSLQR
jgi:hypothetical protein